MSVMNTLRCRTCGLAFKVPSDLQHVTCPGCANTGEQHQTASDDWPGNILIVPVVVMPAESYTDRCRKRELHVRSAGAGTNRTS
jgi:hypothetical protein